MNCATIFAALRSPCPSLIEKKQKVLEAGTGSLELTLGPDLRQPQHHGKLLPRVANQLSDCRMEGALKLKEDFLYSRKANAAWRTQARSTGAWVDEDMPVSPAWPPSDSLLGKSSNPTCRKVPAPRGGSLNQLALAENGKTWITAEGITHIKLPMGFFMKLSPKSLHHPACTAQLSRRLVQGYRP